MTADKCPRCLFGNGPTVADCAACRVEFAATGYPDSRAAELAQLREERDAAIDKLRRLKGWRLIHASRDGEPTRSDLMTRDEARSERRYWTRANHQPRLVRVFAKPKARE